MKNEANIKALNELIVINNDRVEGYRTATEETNDTDLIGIFGALLSTSQNNLSELRAEVVSLGGEIEEGTRTTGKFFRVWMDVKAALTANDRSTILDSCEFGEDKALEAYEEALENRNQLGLEQIALIERQKAKIQADHDKVKALRDASN